MTSDKISIVIAHRGDPMGLWSTVHSCMEDLRDSKIDYEFCICVNGESGTPYKRIRKTSPLTVDTERVMHFLWKAGKLGYLKILQRSISPPTARQLAADRAKGKYLFFFDNHILVAKNYFARSLANFARYDMDMLHSTTKFFEGDNICYHYKLKLEKNFWASSASYPSDNLRSYTCAAGGHGGFAVKADTWRQMGGYWKGFDGYGAEEMTQDLQWWMRGKTVYIDPLLIHYHWAGTRPYARHYSPEYYRNMLMSANIIGGEKWLWKVYDSFLRTHPHPHSKPMYELLQEAWVRSKDEASRLASVRSMSLEDVLEQFRIKQIAY